MEPTNAQLLEEIQRLRGALLAHMSALRLLVREFPELQRRLAGFADSADRFSGVNLAETEKHGFDAEADAIFR